MQRTVAHKSLYIVISIYRRHTNQCLQYEYPEYKAEALTYLDLTSSRLSFALIDLPSVYHPLGSTRSNPVALV